MAWKREYEEREEKKREGVNEGLVVGHYLSIAMKRWRSVLDAGGSLFRLTLHVFFRRPIRR